MTRKKKGGRSQHELFPEAPPKPVIVAHAGPDDELEVIRRAAILGRHWVLARRGPCRAFLTNLEENFGPAVRLLFGEILALMETDDQLGDSDRQFIRNELRSDPENPRPTTDTTLDDLFARIRDFRGSEPYIEGLRFVARLKKYAPFNNLLVFLQRPQLLYYASAAEWQKTFQRRVKGEANPIVILRPMGPVMLVYDVDDTDGPPLPDHVVKPFSVDGAYDSEWSARLVKEAVSDGIEVSGVRLSGRLAGRARRKPEAMHFAVELNSDHNDAEQFATLCHELAHVYLGHVGAGPGWPSRVHLLKSQVELEAESVTHLVSSRLGLATQSVEYLAGYAVRPEDFAAVSLEMVTKVAARLERAACPRPD